jgi:hypothetical protein
MRPSPIPKRLLHKCATLVIFFGKVPSGCQSSQNHFQFPDTYKILLAFSLIVFHKARTINEMLIPVKER